ncbi:MAG: hypothetical protein UX65_C0002G0024 [Parcubacteria group bacterium GW2011_GWB1_46_8]|nr:MAG: hypothetical protein UX15_C0007G0017 [Parcubacteria group bacterium GW2011_GWA1_45_7]KKU46550.1 MAG: hypothetical protein UX65_C0002G0024 [Parcubacteria group bacterium GW2011_GWB1_46_8]KKU47995.1 MAG: hypothetical protein UX66_C0001G0014 [Parcubacteria group bacterium GW2011_GWF2_46_8]
MKVLSHKLTKEQRESHWNNVASHFSPVTDAYSTKLYGDGEWRLFQKFFKDLKGKKLLKLDLWNENFNTPILDRAIEAGMEVNGVDISPEIVKGATEKFRAKYTTGFSFVAADIRNLPYPDHTFDYVYTMGTIEHVPDPQTAIKEIFRVLKPDSIAIIGVPYRYDIFGRAAFIWIGNKLGFLPYGDEMCFSWKQFKALFTGIPFVFTDKSGAYFMPWFIRFADMWLTQHFRAAAMLVRPFLWISLFFKNTEFLLRHTGLVAYIVQKPHAGKET